jgi:hypothetical protein
MDHFAAHFDDVTPEELEAEIAEAIATVRIEERATSVQKCPARAMMAHR